MTLKNLVVNCENSSQPGQVGVAVGRAESVEGLRVLNFKKVLCKKHPVHVTNFYSSFTLGIIYKDLTCCRGQKDTKSVEVHDDSPPAPPDTSVCVNEYADSDFSDSEIEHLDFLDSFIADNILTEGQACSPSKLALDKIITEIIDTPLENDFLLFQKLILCNYEHFDEWFELQNSLIEDIGLNCFPEGSLKYSAKFQNDFFVKFNMYITSDNYKEITLKLLTKYGLSANGPFYQCLTSIVFYLENQLFKTLSTHLQLQPPEHLPKLTVDDSLCGAASGYVIAKLKHKMSVKIRNAIFF